MNDPPKYRRKEVIIGLCLQLRLEEVAHISGITEDRLRWLYNNPMRMGNEENRILRAMHKTHIDPEKGHTMHEQWQVSNQTPQQKRAGHGAKSLTWFVLSNAPAGHSKEAERAYGGHLVCESIKTEDLAQRIAAVPETAAERDRLREINAEMLEALKKCLEEMPPEFDQDKGRNMAKAAIRKATEYD